MNKFYIVFVLHTYVLAKSLKIELKLLHFSRHRNYNYFLNVLFVKYRSVFNQSINRLNEITAISESNNKVRFEIKLFYMKKFLGSNAHLNYIINILDKC